MHQVNNVKKICHDLVCDTITWITHLWFFTGFGPWIPAVFLYTSPLPDIIRRYDLFFPLICWQHTVSVLEAHATKCCCNYRQGRGVSGWNPSSLWCEQFFIFLCKPPNMLPGKEPYLATAPNRSGRRTPVANHIEVKSASWWFWLHGSVDLVTILSESLFHRPNMTRQCGCVSHDPV